MTSPRTRKTKVAKRAPVRRRRDPEQARTEILDAAERLLAMHGPDAVGLKEVAAEAGVSHGLVTHYFGTYAALVGAVFARGTSQIRTRLAERLATANADPEELIGILFEALTDRVHGRLAAWATLSPLGREAILVAVRTQGMRQIADLIEARTSPADAGEEARAARRRDIEFVLLVGLSAAHGYALGGEAMLRSLGHAPGPKEDADFRRRLAALLRSYVGL